MPRGGPGVIALLTDFGLRDPYVGLMKGALLSVTPAARIVDLTHDVAPQDVAGAARTLAAAWVYFPPGTIFVVVVDPCVSRESSRRSARRRANRPDFESTGEKPFRQTCCQVFMVRPPFARLGTSPTPHCERLI